MAVIRCEKCKQHYDDEKYKSCPNCNKNVLDMERTVSIPVGKESMSIGEFENTVSIEVGMGKAIGDEVTISEHSVFTGTQPVVGWLVCVEGKSRGRDYRLHHGWNRIGRSLSMQVCITDDMSISREHGAIVYDERSNSFFVVNENGTIIYLNGKNVTQTQMIKNGDVIEIGAGKFVFVAYCTEGRTW